MRKRLLTLLTAGVLATSLFAGCGSNAAGDAAKTNSAEDKVITIGATPSPHAEILELVKENLAAEGYTLEIVEYNDYVIPNTALEDGDLDANFFQHQPYLDDFNAEKGTHIVSVAAVHFEPMGIYAGKTASVDEVSDGAVVAVPNDTTNEARALLLLEANGLIKLKDGAGITATVLDIEENPLNLEIQELEAAQIPNSLQDVDIAVINGNYALSAGVSDPIAVEASDSLAAETYANIVCVKEGNENTDKTKALVDAVLQDNVKEFIEGKYEGAVVPVF
ncbi:MetQ/NlpA family ABC transporter substrate-binding protein [Butyrivibrio fibrisolvens]|uniref:MetQ/NlpA family ABC transporter substrate-binding protein n=1 Tax=Pseudobutyrivibrio ruminis TaxID=46206 RepID=UPI00040245EC|nr:MetQ/NlpA family ABC transporter substrate-binding protein [Pseudobutyrivibrio ruminis]MDC7277892.1 MetQ/NlpA family ABC transporter substrate-binding protein [Butyrivibrio fibrisolvens]